MHVVFDGVSDGGSIIIENWQQNETDEGLREIGLLAKCVNAVHGEGSAEGCQRNDDDEEDDHDQLGHFGFLAVNLRIIIGINERHLLQYNAARGRCNASTYSCKAFDRGAGFDMDASFAVLLYGSAPDLGVREELEDNESQIHEDEDEGGTSGLADDVVIGALGEEVRCCRDQKAGCGQGQQVRGNVSNVQVETLRHTIHAAKENAGSEDEQDCTENASDKVGLQDVQLSALEQEDAGNDLNGVADGDVRQSSPALAKVQNQLRDRRLGQKSQRHNRNEINKKSR